MAPARTPTPSPAPSPPRPRTPDLMTGVRLSAVTHQGFPDRHQPLVRWEPEMARELLAGSGPIGDLEKLLTGRGNGLIAMSQALLAARSHPLRELDTVLLAYHSPDLFHSDVAGCFLADRLPGTPVPSSVAQPGPGSVFTALRIADGLVRLGQSHRGMLFAFDQNALGHHDAPDAAVLLEFDGDANVLVTDLSDVLAGVAGAPTPGQALAAARQRMQSLGAGRVVAGTALAAAADLPQDVAQVSIPDVPAVCTGVWAEAARLWPLREPLLVADYDAVGHRFHSCLLVPQEGAQAWLPGRAG